MERPVLAPEQAAFDAFWASPALGAEPSAPLEQESPGIRAAWKAAAQAAIDAAVAAVIVAAEGDTVIIAFRNAISQQQERGFRELAERHAPGVKFVFTYDVDAATGAAEGDPLARIAELTGRLAQAEEVAGDDERAISNYRDALCAMERECDEAQAAIRRVLDLARGWDLRPGEFGRLAAASAVSASQKRRIGVQQEPFKRPEGCICVMFADTGGVRIADLTCPVHGVDGTAPGDGYWCWSPATSGSARTWLLALSTCA